MATTFKTKNTTSKRELETTVDFGKDLDDAAKKFGKDVVHALFIDAATIQYQGRIRAALGDKSKSNATILADVKTMRPKIGRTSDPVKKKARILSGIQSLPEAERAAIIAQLTGAKPQLVKAKKAA